MIQKKKAAEKKIDDEKVEFLIEKMEQYLSFFFFYKKPYSATGSIRPFRNFLQTELLNGKVKEILESSKGKNDYQSTIDQIKRLYYLIMHFGSMVERLSTGFFNYPDETLKTNKQFLQIQFPAKDIHEKDRRISDTALVAQYKKKFGVEEYFGTELQVIKWFSESGLTRFMKGKKVVTSLIYY